MKTELLAYLRFTRGVKLLASECGFMASDILFVRNKQLYEIEIKTSWADFKNDFKKPKHDLYLGKGIDETYKERQFAKDSNGKFLRDEKGYYIPIGTKLRDCYYHNIPNYLLFAVTKELVDKVQSYLQTNYPLYGLVSIDDNRPFGKNSLSIIKPKNIHKRPVHPIMESTIISRMSSELTGAKMKLYKREINENNGN